MIDIFIFFKIIHVNFDFSFLIKNFAIKVIFFIPFLEFTIYFDFQIVVSY